MKQIRNVMIALTAIIMLSSCTKEPVTIQQDNTIASCDNLTSGKTSSTCCYPQPIPSGSNNYNYSSTCSGSWPTSGTNITPTQNSFWDNFQYVDQDGTTKTSKFRKNYPFCQSVCFELELSKSTYYKTNLKGSNSNGIHGDGHKGLKVPHSVITNALVNLNGQVTSPGLSIPNWNPVVSNIITEKMFFKKVNGVQVTQFNEVYWIDSFNNNKAPFVLPKKNDVYFYNIGKDVGEWAVWRFGFNDDNGTYFTGNITIKITQ